MFETSAIELSASALQNNLRFIKKIMNTRCRFWSAVKGNAYGHGFSEFVQMAMKEGVDFFAVYSAEEVFLLKENDPEIPDLFVMWEKENEAIEWAIFNGIEFAFFDLNRLSTALY